MLNGEHPEVVLNVLFMLFRHTCEQNGVEMRDVMTDYIEQHEKRGSSIVLPPGTERLEAPTEANPGGSTDGSEN